MHEFCARHKVQDDLRVNASTRRCQQAWRRTNRGVCSGDCHHSRHLDNSSCSGRSPCAVTVSNSTKLRSQKLSLSGTQLSTSTEYATVLFTCCHNKLLPLPLPCNDTYRTHAHPPTHTHTQPAIGNSTTNTTNQRPIRPARSASSLPKLQRTIHPLLRRRRCVVVAPSLLLLWRNHNVESTAPLVRTQFTTHFGLRSIPYCQFRIA